MSGAVTPTLSPSGTFASPKAPSWRAALDPYAHPHLGRSSLGVVTSVVTYLGLLVAMYFLLDVSHWLVLAVSVPTAGFLVRTYIVFHDCAHGNFLPWSKANEWLGAACGLLVFTPFQRWRHQHAVHHATSGDLDRRGIGDVPTLTVTEYEALPSHRRLGYRLLRNPIVMFGLGPVWAMILAPRFVSRGERPRIRRSVRRTNLALAAVIGLCCWLIGWESFLLVEMPSALLAGSIGVWLFYIQHQFEDAYWQSSDCWSYDEAALKGSSYLRLPRVLQFFTGNIGLHHVHHLSTRIPNYNLQRTHDAHPVFRQVPTLSLRDGMKCIRLKLWDEERGRLVTFHEAHARQAETRHKPLLDSPAPRA
ncbi:MAG TPA: fatty acid desaturase [Solirubrobacteraceae bacterium]|jgi:omega-6 fatty acid desaturase (delta-12 desaturase)